MNKMMTGKWIGPSENNNSYPVLFKDFTVSYPIKNATLYIASLGSFEAYINGKKVGAEYMTPYINSEYGSIQYYEYDVTQFIKCGEDAESNSIDVFLGKGIISSEIFALKAEVVVTKGENCDEEYFSMEPDEISSDDFELDMSMFIKEEENVKPSQGINIIAPRKIQRNVISKETKVNKEYPKRRVVQSIAIGDVETKTANHNYGEIAATNFTDGFLINNVSEDLATGYLEEHEDYFARKRRLEQSKNEIKVDAKEFGDFSKSNYMGQSEEEIKETAESQAELENKIEIEEPTIAEESTITEEPTEIEAPTVAEEPTIAEESTITEEPTVVEEPTFIEEQFITEQALVTEGQIEIEGLDVQEEKTEAIEEIEFTEADFDELIGEETVLVSEDSEFTEYEEKPENTEEFVPEISSEEILEAVAIEAEIEKAQETISFKADESEESEIVIVCTDGTWGYYASDIVESDANGFEIFNRILWEDKDNPDREVEVLDLNITLEEPSVKPLVVGEVLLPIESRQTKEGIVLDFGKQFIGYVSFLSNIPHGSTIVIEIGDEENRFDKGRFEYTSDGVEEIACPHFAIYEGRYARISGLTAQFIPENFKANVLCQKVLQTGILETSEEVLNTAVNNFCNQLKAKSMDKVIAVGEEVLFTEEMAVNAKSSLYMLDCKETYKEFFSNLRTAQNEMNGAIPEYVPFDENAREYFGDGVSSVPWNIYMITGEKQFLEENATMIETWIKYVDEEMIQNNIIVGDTDEQTFIFTAAYASALSYAGKVFAELGKEEQGNHFTEQSKVIKENLKDEFYTRTGRFALDDFECIAAALKYDVICDKERLVNHLVDLIKNGLYEIYASKELSANIISILAENGKVDLAYRLLMNGKCEVPCEFMVEQIAGIKPLEAGLSRVVIEPKYNSRVIYENCSISVGEGEIVSDWEVLENGKIRTHIEIPHGIRARVIFNDWDDEDMRCQELSAGTYYFEFKPEHDYIHIFNENSIINDVVSYRESLDILEEINPEVAKAIIEADDYVKCEPLDFIPLTDDEMAEFKEKISVLK